MKKLFLFAAVAVFSLSSAYSQGELRGGLTGGVPIGDSGDFYTFTFGLDVSYLFEITEDINVGGATGFSTSFGESFSSAVAGVDVQYKDFNYLPIAAAGRYNVFEGLVVGADLGYAVVLTDGADGGLYYRPMAGYNITEKIQATLSYRGISVDNGSFSSITVGASYRIL